MCEILAIRVPPVQVEAIRLNLADGNPPRALTLDAALARCAAPPRTAIRELIEAHRLRLRVLLTFLGRSDFVEPDLSCASRLLEEQEVGWDVGVGSEDTLGKTHDRMEVAFTKKTFLHARCYPVAKEQTVRHNHAASATGLEHALDDLKKQQRGLGCPGRLREVGLDRPLLLAAKRRISQDDIHAISSTDLGHRVGERVVADDRWLLDPVEHQ